MATEETKVNAPVEEAAEEAVDSKPKKAKKEKKGDCEKLRVEIEKLTNELANAKDTHLRVLAEYDNFRKRSAREKEALYGDAKANTLKTLLPVIDNFDRAADNKTDDIEVYRKGIEMTLTQLGEILKNLEVEAFDPNIHNAVMTVENDELPENSIAAVFEKGYRMGDRILRFATVQVTN